MGAPLTENRSQNRSAWGKQQRPLIFHIFNKWVIVIAPVGKQTAICNVIGKAEAKNSGGISRTHLSEG